MNCYMINDSKRVLNDQLHSKILNFKFNIELYPIYRIQNFYLKKKRIRMQILPDRGNPLINQVNSVYGLELYAVQVSN